MRALRIGPCVYFLICPPSRSSQPGMTLFPKKNAPWRRVVRAVRVAEGKFYDELECGHRESHDHQAKKRRCRTCADPTFPGITFGNPEPPVVVVEEKVPNSTPSTAPAASSPPIPLVLTVAEVAKLASRRRLRTSTPFLAFRDHGVKFFPADCGDIEVRIHRASLWDGSPFLGEVPDVELLLRREGVTHQV